MNTFIHSFEILSQQSTGYSGVSTGYWILLGCTTLASLLVSWMLKRRFAQHSQAMIPFTGAQVADMMLRAHGINDVKIIQVNGQLTDHYDPISKTVNLSEVVYDENSVAAAAVAAHEVGHAVQHQQAYKWLSFRSKMVPVVSIASQMMNYVFFIGLFGAISTKSPMILFLMVACLAVTTAFAFITLPVEIDASKRALAWMEKSGITRSIDHDRAKNALHWAAMTYVVGALSSAAMLVYYLLQMLGVKNEEN